MYYLTYMRYSESSTSEIESSMVVARGSRRGSLISTEVFVFIRVLEVAVVMVAQ